MLWPSALPAVACTVVMYEANSLAGITCDGYKNIQGSPANKSQHHTVPFFHAYIFYLFFVCRSLIDYLSVLAATFLLRSSALVFCACCVARAEDDLSRPTVAAAGSAAGSEAATQQQVLLTPTGAAVVGIEVANVMAKTHRARISSDQRVSRFCRCCCCCFCR